MEAQSFTLLWGIDIIWCVIYNHFIKPYNQYRILWYLVLFLVHTLCSSGRFCMWHRRMWTKTLQKPIVPEELFDAFSFSFAQISPISLWDGYNVCCIWLFGAKGLKMLFERSKISLPNKGASFMGILYINLCVMIHLCNCRCLIASLTSYENILLVFHCRTLKEFIFVWSATKDFPGEYPMLITLLRIGICFDLKLEWWPDEDIWIHRNVMIQRHLNLNFVIILPLWPKVFYQYHKYS